MIIAKSGATLESHDIVQGSMALEVKDLNIYENASIKAINEINEGRDLSSKINVEFVDENNEFNGKYNRENNTIYLSKNTTKALRQVLTHEISHAMENNAEYNDILQEMVDNLVEDENFNKIKEKVREDYKDQNLSEADINNESITEYIADNFFKSYSDLSKAFTNKTTLEKFKNMIRNLRSGSKNNSLREQYLKLFQKLNNTNVVQNTNKKAKKKYSIKHNSNKNVDKATDEAYDGDAKKVSYYDKNHMYVTAAPFRDTLVNKDNFNDLRNKVETKYRNIAIDIAKHNGIKVVNMFTNEGGYNEKGNFVNELSYTFELTDCTEEQAKWFAMLMGDLGHEVQCTVIASKYVEDINYKDSCLEYCISVKSIEHVSKLCAELFGGENEGYTLDLSNKIIKIYVLNEEMLNKIDKLLDKLGGNYNGFEESAVHSEFISREDRRDTYEAWLATAKTSNKDRIYFNYVSEAKRRVEKDLKLRPSKSNDKFSLKSKNDIKETREFAKQTIDKFNIMVDGTGVSFVDTKGSLDKLLLKLVNNTSKVEDVRKKRYYRFLKNSLLILLELIAGY